MKNKILIFFCLLSLNLFSQRDFYELRSYELKWGTNVNTLHNYLKTALIPVLNRMDVNDIGVFEEISNNLPKRIYVLIPYSNMNHYNEVYFKLFQNKEYKNTSKEYNSLPLDKIPYSRYETSFFIAFKEFPRILKPKEGMSIFELRNYEAHNEDAYRRKVKMFNEGEIDIFNDVGLNSVFYGEKISGLNMPVLSYMLVYESMESRSKSWKKFFNHPDWKNISNLDEYSNTVSNITSVFLKPLDYSQL